MPLSKSKRGNSFICTLLASCESRLEALSQTNRAVRTRRSGRRDPTGSNKPDSDSASRPSGETRGKTLSGRCCSPPEFEPVHCCEFRWAAAPSRRSEEHTSELQSLAY